MPIANLERAEPPADMLAPRWHTVLLVTLMLAVATAGALLARAGHAVAPSPAQGRTVAVYLPVLAVNGALLFYVCRVGRPANALRALLGRGWSPPRRAATDLALAASLWLLVEACESAASPWRNAAVASWLPHTGVERAAWVLVAASVGFCEEVVYRGYLQLQLAAFTRSAVLAVVLQGVLFGLAHGEQGLGVVMRFAVYGVLLGVVARWRRSLVPGIVAHVALDAVSGLLPR